ncbi:DUF4301 family protein [Prevotella fusca]
MLNKEDLKQIHEKGISAEQIGKQLEEFKRGFPYLKLEGAATSSKGVTVLDKNACEAACRTWQGYQADGHKVVKFVPASGAASRMFKDLFAFLNGSSEVPVSDFEKEFFSNIHRFAFFEELSGKCQQLEGKTADELIADGRYKAVVATLLNKEGLNYGQLPKGLLLFHSYADGMRTPMEEHLVEAARYAESNKQAHVHFTVSHEHLEFFKQKVADKQAGYEAKFGVGFDISFSEQKPSTDTIAVNLDNTPFRNEDESLLFRPGGHGALIENLNDLDADVVFIKNIDNVVPDRLKDETVIWKMIIAGKLVELQERAFAYLRQLEHGACMRAEMEEMVGFLQNELSCESHNVSSLDDAALADYLYKKLNRPMRVCGMVKNVGEPGGGPFLAYNQDGTVSLQILESSQIDKNDAASMKMFTEGTHFNPVDLVCAIKDYKGNAFDLTEYVDKSTGFISSKSKNGRDLKALELPGLWNGAMSDWNTVFVEVPLGTFNPVKTVNDLLREQHQ